ncbi:hypothetical protein OG607_33770 [Streptomyces sp. NBC_01537]|uniref:hypothetical protein n=1 Tax=Streptomyces sp. NBC_01537 TaxID=2903896 RepID=UPI0038631992
MSERVGYGRCSRDKEGITAQREVLLGRPCLAQALAAVRARRTLVVPKLDRLALSGPDARNIGDSLTARRQAHPVKPHPSGEHTIASLAQLTSGGQ